MKPLFACCLFLLFPLLIAVGCAGPGASNAPPPPSIAKPIHVASADLAVTLTRVMGAGDKGSLVGDPGWHEYILDIENRGTGLLAINTVKLLSPNGRYVESATTYGQIIEPPDLGTELAGDVAERAAGMAAGQFIPYGGKIFSILSGAASATSASGKARAKRDFTSRVLNQVELAPAGRVTGSAFLPNIPGARVLTVKYNQGGMADYIDIPLPPPEP